LQVAPEVPATSDDALRPAIKLAVDAGEYERAAVVLDVLRRTMTRGAIPPIASARPLE
jgi:hypothetical protein